MKKGFKGTYIDLDSLFDTRLALAMLLSPEITLIELKNGNYYNRVTHNIGTISSEIFTTLYSVRNKNLLKMAPPTSLLNKLVIPQYLEILKDKTQIDENNLPPYYINVYPYELTQTEIDNLKKGYLTKLPNENINIINIPFSKINFKWINDHVSLIYMFDGLKWLEYAINTYSLVSEPIIDTSLVTPLVIYGSKKEFAMNNNVKQLIDSYRIIIDLYLVDMELYCGNLL